MKLEMSKLFGLLAITGLAVGRVFFANFDNTLPIGMPFIYPLISMKIYNKIGAFIFTMITQIYVNTLVFEGFGTRVDEEGLKTNYDFILTIILGFLMLGINVLVPYMGLESKKRDGMKKVNE